MTRHLSHGTHVQVHAVYVCVCTYVCVCVCGCYMMVYLDSLVEKTGCVYTESLHHSNCIYIAAGLPAQVLDLFISFDGLVTS